VQSRGFARERERESVFRGKKISVFDREGKGFLFLTGSGKGFYHGPIKKKTINNSIKAVVK
jgi:hypothetical protein